MSTDIFHPEPALGGTRTLERALWMALLVMSPLLGFLQAWATRYEVSGDGVNYLDVGDAFLRRDWGMAINGLWSPLYGWLIAAVAHLVKAPPATEFTVVHLVNFCILLVSLASFSFFVSGLLRYRALLVAEGGRDEASFLSTDLVRLSALAIWLYGSLDLIGLTMVNPDLLVSALVYLLFGILTRIRARHATALHGVVAVGLAVGCGYWLKTVMLPVGGVILAVAIVAVRGRKRARWAVALSVGVMVCLSAPLMFSLSRKAGHFMIGDSGRLNYAWRVNGVSDRHWQGLPPGSGVPLHPTRLILAYPQVFEFAQPIGGTYPVWLDPSYWYAGLRTPIEPRLLLSAMRVNLTYLIWLFMGPRGALLAVGLAMASVVSRQEASHWLRRMWWLVLPCVVALGGYVAVNLESRYVAPFLCVLWVAAIATATFERREGARRMITISVLALVAMLLVPLGPVSRSRYYSTLRDLIGLRRGATNEYYSVAKRLREEGLRTDDRVASATHALKEFDNVSWARLARVRVVAEVFYTKTRPETEKNYIWGLNAADRQRALGALAATGARCVVAQGVPAWADTTGWERIAGTGYWVYWLSS